MASRGPDTSLTTASRAANLLIHRCHRHSRDTDLVTALGIPVADLAPAPNDFTTSRPMTLEQNEGRRPFRTAPVSSRWRSFKKSRTSHFARRRWSRRDRTMVVCSWRRSDDARRLKSLRSSLQLGDTRHHEPTRAGLSSQLRGTEQHQLDGCEGPPRSTKAPTRSNAS